MMGPIEASFRDQAVAARRRLMNGYKPPVLIEAAPTNSVPEEENEILPDPVVVDQWPSQPRPAPYDLWNVPSEPPIFRMPKSSRTIIREVAVKHGLSPAQITGPCRERRVATARHEAAFRIVFELGYSYPKTGRHLGDRDHTTILNSLRRHAEANPEARVMWERHVELMEEAREKKHEPALRLYFDAGMTIGQISGILRVATMTVTKWVRIEQERRMERVAA